MLMKVLYTLSVVNHLICSNNQSLLLNLNPIYKTLWTETGSGLLISKLEKLNLFCLTGLTSLLQKLVLNIIHVKMDGSVLEEKSSFKILRLPFSSKLDCGSYIISIVKTVSDEIRISIRSMKFSPPEVGLSLFKSTIRPWMEYCCHFWAGAPSCYLEMLDKLQKGYLGLFVLHFQLLLNPQAIGKIQLAYVLPVGITLVDFCLNWLNWFHFLILVEDLLVILGLHDFPVTIPRCYQDFYVNRFFPRTTRYWNSLPTECFVLSYDLNGFKSVQPCTLELTDHFICKFFLSRFPVCFSLYISCNYMSRSSCSALYGVNLN